MDKRKALSEIEKTGNKTYEELWSEVRDIFIANVCDYVPRLVVHRNSLTLYEGFNDYFKPNPNAVFVAGRLFPIMDFDRNKYRVLSKHEEDSGQYSSRPTWNIRSFEDFIRCDGTVIDQEKKVVCRNPKQNKAAFSPTSQYSVGAVASIAHCLAQSIKENQDPNAYVSVLDIPPLKSYLKDEFDPELVEKRAREQDEHNALAKIEGRPLDYSTIPEFNIWNNGKFLNLQNRVLEFIGRDRFNNVTIRIKGTTLYVEKGNDYRVLAYYKNIFDQVHDIYGENYSL